MADKIFPTALFGFKKQTVIEYMEMTASMLDEKEDKIREQEEKLDEINREYDKIAKVLLKAEAEAEEIVDNAKQQASVEKAKIEKMLEEERESVVDVKKELKHLRESAKELVAKLEGDVENLVE